MLQVTETQLSTAAGDKGIGWVAFMTGRDKEGLTQAGNVICPLISWIEGDISVLSLSISDTPQRQDIHPHPYSS